MKQVVISTRAEQQRRLATAVLIASAVIACWYFSRWTYEVYRLGDLYHYRRFWDLMVWTPQSLILNVQRSATGSAEPLYGYFVWLLSAVGHDVVLPFINVLLVVALVLLLRKHHVPAILFPLILTNFYLIILLSSAERLKFGLLALVFAFLAFGRLRYFLALVAPFFHLQSLLFMLPIAADAMLSKEGESAQASRLRRISAVMAIMIGLAVIVGFLSAPLVDKVIGYAENSSAFPWQSLIAIILAVAFLRKQTDAIVALIAILFAAVLLGGSRVNMVSSILLMAMFIREKKFFHPVFLAILLYLSLKGLSFIQTYAIHGTGWPDSTGVLN